MASRSRDEIHAEMMAAGQALPPFEAHLPILEGNLKAARANLALAEQEGDTALIEDWRLTVACHKCAVALNLANQQVLNRTLVRGTEELAAL